MNTIQRWASALLLASTTLAAHADDVTTWLQTADGYRMSSDNLQVDTQISVFNTDGSLDKERRYLVFAQAGHRALVMMQSPAERGQKMLMLGDDYWLLMPASQRPLRITPMQKLLGDASSGDIATLSWAGDYAGTLVGDEPCGDPAQTCRHLSLAATRKSVSYQRIELWLGKTHGEPVRADLYVLSDKLEKQARFVVDQPAKPTKVVDMLLRDQLTNKKATRVRYLERQPRSVPEAWLNPMFLARNPALE